MEEGVCCGAQQTGVLNVFDIYMWRDKKDQLDSFDPEKLCFSMMILISPVQTGQ